MKVLKVLTRAFVSQEDFDDVVAFYENIFSEQCKLRFKYPDTGLELANVGFVLIISGSDAALSPFQETKATFLVDCLDDFRDVLKKQGGVLLDEPRRVPTGANMRVKHPDGLVVEYVEFF